MSGKEVPIEVKSGKSYKAHKALSNFMNVTDYHLEKAYVFSKGNIEKNGAVIYLPIYMLMFIHRNPQPKEQIYNLDLSGLK